MSHVTKNYEVRVSKLKLQYKNLNVLFSSSEQTGLISSGIGIINCCLYNRSPGVGLGKGRNKIPMHMRYDKLNRLLMPY